jgi:phosphoribosylanthranilate isomerase
VSIIVRVKICGIQSLEEALWAAEAGADALGFIFVPRSKRYIQPEKAQAITAKLPPFVNKVGVFAGASPSEVAEMASLCTLDTIQLHGEENPELYHQIPATKIKVISYSSNTLANKKFSPHSLHGVLLDSTFQGQLGGTGIPLPWQDPPFQSFLQEIKDVGLPVILAGGLNPENVQDAIKQTQPYGVDVSSGVERNGHKDRDLIRKFISRVKNL